MSITYPSEWSFRPSERQQIDRSDCILPHFSHRISSTSRQTCSSFITSRELFEHAQFISSRCSIIITNYVVWMNLLCSNVLFFLLFLCFLCCSDKGTFMFHKYSSLNCQIHYRASTNLFSLPPSFLLPPPFAAWWWPAVQGLSGPLLFALPHEDDDM